MRLNSVRLLSVDTQYLFHPIPLKPDTLTVQPVDLLVSNLDENITVTDLKNLLFVVFNKHCTVSVDLPVSTSIFAAKSLLMYVTLQVTCPARAHTFTNLFTYSVYLSPWVCEEN